MQEEILQRLDAFAEKLGVAAPQLWEILLRQVQIEAITNLVALVVLTAILISSYYAVRWGLKKDAEPSYYGEAGAHAVVIGGIVGIISLVAIPFVATYAMLYFLNPEFYAFQSLLGK